MNYCTVCGHPLQVLVPPGDNRPRHVCSHCGEIHYQNPKLVVGAIPRWRNQVLLCRRAIEPRLGWWTLPAGFMENGESTVEAAMRETWEEAGALVEIDTLQALIDVPVIQQVHLFYRANLLSLDVAPGEESLETRLFPLRHIPWDELAFETVRAALAHHLRHPRHGVLVKTLGQRPARSSA